MIHATVHPMAAMFPGCDLCSPGSVFEVTCRKQHRLGEQTPAPISEAEKSDATRIPPAASSNTTGAAGSQTRCSEPRRARPEPCRSKSRSSEANGKQGARRRRNCERLRGVDAQINKRAQRPIGDVARRIRRRSRGDDPVSRIGSRGGDDWRRQRRHPKQGRAGGFPSDRNSGTPVASRV